MSITTLRERVPASDQLPSRNGEGAGRAHADWRDPRYDLPLRLARH